MKIKDLKEARRNANHPAQQVDRIPGKGKLSSSDLLKKFIGKDLFVSFTNLDKIGVNTNTPKGETPVGLYAFPLNNDEVLNQFKNYDYRNFMFILKSKTHMINVSEYTYNDLANDFIKLKNKYPLDDNIPSFDDLELLKKRLSNNNNISQKEINYMKNTFGVFFGNLPSPVLPFSFLYELTREMANHNELVWTKLLQSIGINGIIDNGNSVIHENEPIQAVFFKRKHIEIVDRFKIDNNSENYDNDTKQRKFHKINDMYMNLSNDNKLKFLLTKINWMSINFHDNKLIGSLSYLTDIIKRSPDSVLENFINTILTRKSFNMTRQRIITMIIAVKPHLKFNFKSNKEFEKIINLNKDYGYKETI